MPFGLKNVPTTFQKLMECSRETSIQKSVLFFADILFSETLKIILTVWKRCSAVCANCPSYVKLAAYVVIKAGYTSTL